jgi:signal transduction histidine kinase
MTWVRPTRGDLLVAAVATLFGAVSVLAASPAESNGVSRHADVLGVLLGVLSTAPIALRRSAPFPVLAVTSAAVVLASARGSAIGAAGLGPTLAATSAAYLTDRRGALAAGVLFAVTAMLATHLAFDGLPGEAVQLVTTVVIAVLATVIGDVLRVLHQRNGELELLRGVEAREAVAEDRVRIAREVHDIVGHALAGIALQARAGRRLVDHDPQRTGEALRQIDELATRALGETREAIGRIRGAAAPAELRPQPRLDDLTWSPGCRRPTCASRCAARATPAGCRRPCRRRRSGSCRRRSATWSSTPGRPAPW